MTHRRLLLSACLLALAGAAQTWPAQGTSGLKRWPVQSKGQEGLRAPREPATMPKSRAASSRPQARPAPNTRPALEARGAGEWALAGGWRMAEAPKTSVAAADISRPGFDAGGWLGATVPGTVLTTYVERGVYPDPDFGLNNLAIPETLNKHGYWFRTEFRPAAGLRGRRFTLTLHGVNYAAGVWLNGRPLGEVRGAFRRGEFDATALVVPGRANSSRCCPASGGDSPSSCRRTRGGGGRGSLRRGGTCGT